MSETLSFDIQQILKILPHRYPFLLVDRVTEMVPGERVKAYKNLTFNEPFFQGHFPDVPVMPGVLIIEALAQAGVLLVVESTPEFKDNPDDQVYLFAGIEKARFRAPVRPGDQLVLECVSISHKMNIWKMDAKAYVDGKLACEAILTAASIPRRNSNHGSPSDPSHSVRCPYRSDRRRCHHRPLCTHRGRCRHRCTYPH